MIVFPKREEFIKENFFEFSFKDKKPDFEKFKTLNSTELHFLSEIYNWDDGVEVLKWVVESKKCDQGTASMIFWRSVPDYYLGKSESEIREYEKGIFDLLKLIIQNFRNNTFKKTRLKYNPNEDFNFESNEKEIRIWNLPQEMIQPTRGIKPIYLGTTIKFLRNQYKKSKKRRRRNK